MTATRSSTATPPAATGLATREPLCTSDELTSAIVHACDRIAPAWPLDRLIAVNPYWGFIGAPIEQAAAELSALSGATLLMPRAWYREQFTNGRFGAEHVARTIARDGIDRSVADVLAALDVAEPAARPLPLMTDMADIDRDLGHAMSWGEFVTRQVSQTCAAFFDEGQAQWGPARAQGLFPLWRELALHDNSPRLLMGLRGFRECVAALPSDPLGLIAEAMHALRTSPGAANGYLTALLLSINGWASVCAFRRWEARLAGQDDEQLVHLLATRLAWELVLFRLGNSEKLSADWEAARWQSAASATMVTAARQNDWILQGALELAYQERIARDLGTAITALPKANRTANQSTAPSARVVFCIDVRSEVFRRAIEEIDPTIRTLGFAGFFGLPIAYQPLSGPARPQLPGLIAPSLVVEDAGAARDGAVAAAAQRTTGSAAWKALGGTASSAFSFVEAAGVAWAGALVRDGFALGARKGDALRETSARHNTLRPEIARGTNGMAVDLPARVALAAGILRAMSLTREFAPILALIGHGASTTNNPLAAGLHCGACGGQTGEVNARALAALLNDSAVRTGLAEAGLDLGDTHVIAGLHDTTTDDVTLYDDDRTPATHAMGVAALTAQFAAAGRKARRERAPGLGLAGTSEIALDLAVRTRARDWSEVRPEWGLASNACFVVAPRDRTRGVNLAGRSFLHEYRWHDDTDFRVLESILTAPMVVTHWINMQYHASTVDPVRYGSGNKVLHNVVGGRIGVMEGAGGDLRIGLARQSVHDGQRWMHEPLRLSVFVEAPAEAIDAILARHATVRALVEHRWLHLHRIDSSDGSVLQRGTAGWHPTTFRAARVP